MATLLGAAIIGTSAPRIITTVGTDIAIRTLTTTTSSIGSLISYLTTNNNSSSDINSTLISLDLEFTISIIENVVKEYDEKELNEPLKKALLGVHEILELINKELNLIKEAIEYHNSKYFKNWRSFSWSGNTEAIKQHNNTLKSRYSMLLELLKIYSKK